MTERVYCTSDTTDGCTQIIACTVEADDRYAIELDQTLFHPQGGGQPADRGWIAGQVAEMVIIRGDNVLYILSQPLPLDDMEMKIDAPTKQLHARLHSADHLLDPAGGQPGWQPVKARRWSGGGRITFTNRNNVALPDTSALLTPAKIWQARDLLRRVMFAGGLRQVGPGELPAYPCGGTHAARLAELGDIAISRVEMKRGQLAVSYVLA